MVHEFGHFIAAKKSGVQVNEFWIGMGPILFKKQIKGTEYSLRAFPIGGAVVMEENTESESTKSFANAKLYKRAIIVSAGAIMNFLLGFLVIFILFLPVEKFADRKIDDFAEGFKYQGQNALMPGDEILKINEHGVFLNSDITFALNRYQGSPYDILVNREGQKVLLKDIPLKPEKFVVDGQEVYRYGINFKTLDATFGEKVKTSLYTGFNFARMVWISLSDLVTGHVSINQLSGVIGISVVLGESAKQSASSLWTLVAFISINLGVMNLIPLPALDGGRMVFIAWEAIFRKPVNAKIETFVHTAGFAALMMLTIYITFKDIVMVFFQ